MIITAALGLVVQTRLLVTTLHGQVATTVLATTVFPVVQTGTLVTMIQMQHAGTAHVLTLAAWIQMHATTTHGQVVMTAHVDTLWGVTIHMPATTILLPDAMTVAATILAAPIQMPATIAGGQVVTMVHVCMAPPVARTLLHVTTTLQPFAATIGTAPTLAALIHMPATTTGGLVVMMVHADMYTAVPILSHVTTILRLPATTVHAPTQVAQTLMPATIITTLAAMMDLATTVAV
jgi:hypothetical protein